MKLNVKIFKKLLYSTLISGVIFSTVSHAQGLLDKVKVEEKKSLSLQIYDDILAPILNYDENAVTVKVLDDLSIFEGVNDYYRTENSNNYYKVPNPNFTGDFFPTQYDSDRDIYRVLGAKPEELLLKINVEVRLTPEYINKIETFLKENTQHNLTYDGNPNEHNTTGYFDRRKFPTRFFIGSLKGNERIRTHFTKTPYNLAPNIFARLGLKNQQAVDPFDMLKKDERKGLYFAKPYQIFAFDQGIENGVLCKNTLSHIAKKRALEHVTKWNHAPGVKDRKVGLGNHALSGGFFYDIRPRLKLSFKSATGETIHADVIAFYKNQTTKFRTTSMGTMPLDPPLQSVVTIDPKNGWHNDDRYLTSKTPGREYAQIPMEHMRNLIINTPYPPGCEFTISYQNNFSVVTKVTKDLLAKTEKIDAKMFYHAIYPDIWVDVYKTIHTGTFYLDEQKSSIRIEYMGAGDNKISSIIVNKGEGTGEKGGIKLFPESSQRDMIVHW